MNVYKRNIKEIEKILSPINGIASIVSSDSDVTFANKETSGFLISISEKKEIRPEIVKKLVENNIDLYEMKILQNSLEDVFHTLTTQKKAFFCNNEARAKIIFFRTNCLYCFRFIFNNYRNCVFFNILYTRKSRITFVF